MFRAAKLLIAGVTLVSSIIAPPAQAAWFGYPKALKSQFERIGFQMPAVAPFAYTHFCLRYANDCRVHGRAFRKPHAIELTQARMGELTEVNHAVNRAITPQAYIARTSFDTWRIGPTQGDCNDFAVTKRHELLARGWPSRALLLAEVITSWGEHHLILVVRTANRDVVLDSLNYSVRDWAQTSYQWVRIQSPSNPEIWSTVQSVVA
jgi:predicted transglutaminase-like cysteine proteinase